MQNSMKQTVRQNLQAQPFEESTWENLVSRMAQSFSLDEKKAKAMKENKVMKLVAALPYLAGCEEPGRIAITHLGAYILAASPACRDIADHNFIDSADPYRRLERISHFNGGNSLILERGMKLLALAMVKDHAFDAADDLAKGKMNPVNAGHWDAEELMTRLTQEIEAVECPEMDKVMTAEMAPEFWMNE
ncbi:MAG: hypothetical protein MI717_08115 [Spirochaetales bacterium]|nr:hypothetical protein [Spirochaetales bacterium]